MKKKHAPLLGSVRGYIRVISVGMLLQIQTDIYIYIYRALYEIRSTQKTNIYIYIYIYIYALNTGSTVL